MLGHFKSLLNHNTFKTKPKEAADATIEFLQTVVTGHFLACVCQLLRITKLSSCVDLPPGLLKSTPEQQQAYVRELVTQVVEQCTLVENACTARTMNDAGDHVYNDAKCCATSVHRYLSSEMAGQKAMGKECTAVGDCFYPTSRLPATPNTHWRHCVFSFKLR